MFQELQPEAAGMHPHCSATLWAVAARAAAMRVLLTAVVISMVAIPLPPTPAAASQATTEHIVVDGVAEIFGSTCPFGDWLPEQDTICEDWLVTFAKESQPPQHNRAAWGLQLIRALSVVRPDGTVDTLQEAAGTTYSLDAASFDEKHLKFAYVKATVPMSDGTRRAVDLTWDGSDADRQVAGNSGPYLLNRGIDHHYVDRCFTFNQNVHQTYRPNVTISGTVDGTDVNTIPYFVPTDPFLGRGRFTIAIVVHGSCD